MSTEKVEETPHALIESFVADVLAIVGKELWPQGGSSIDPTKPGEYVPARLPSTAEVAKRKRHLGLALLRYLADRVPDVDAPKEMLLNQIAALHIERSRLRGEVAELQVDVNQLGVQLAGCSVAALGGARGDHDAPKGSYGWSQPFDDVKRLREQYERLVTDAGADANERSRYRLALQHVASESYFAEPTHQRPYAAHVLAGGDPEKWMP